MLNAADITVSTIFFTNLVQVLEKMGHTLRSTITSDDNDLIPAMQLADAWSEAVQLTQDKNLGLHLGEQSTIGRWGIVEQLLNHSASFQECIDHSIRYWKLVGFSDLDINFLHEVPIETLALEKLDKQTAAITLHTKAPFRHIAESDAVYTLRMMQMLLATDFKPTAIWFMHDEPADISEHRRILGVTPSFNRPYFAIFFDQAWIAEKRTIDPTLIQLLREHAERRLLALNATTNFHHKVSVLLEQDPTITVAQAAKRLNLSTRNLQSKLEQANIGFSEIKDQVRSNKAKLLLADSTLSLGEIAFMLGFADSSTFSHFCKRCLGVAPSQWRKTHTM